MILAAVAALLVTIGFLCKANVSRGESMAQADTLVVNTTELCKDVIGYDGPTPLKIYVVKGVVVKVEALPNTETPRFFDQVVESGLLKAVVGKKVSEAATMPLDAVTGATYSSQAVIENLRAGLKEAAKR
jgi:electron transport complex protein RnfG